MAADLSDSFNDIRQGFLTGTRTIMIAQRQWNNPEG